VEQFQRLERNWNWHSSMARAAPTLTESMKLGFFLQKVIYAKETDVAVEDPSQKPMVPALVCFIKVVTVNYNQLRNLANECISIRSYDFAINITKRVNGALSPQ
jgi:hypothetical protein